MSSDLASLLFGAARRDVLAQLLLHPGESLHVRELARLTGRAPGTLLRELNQLAEAGILTRTPVGNQVHFSANEACPIFEELRGIVRKTAGIADVLRAALGPLAARIRVAFVYGSMARGDERRGSDVDLLVVGGVDFAVLVGALQPAQRALRREINPNLIGEEEWGKRRAVSEPFLSRVIQGPKLFVVGGPDDLGEPAPHRKAPAARRRKG
ncbi:MAG: helix-turn-helix domain-containing protein [Betaproteobacteria bacterium]|nr:helix-turn-helix domain-containing protein [Betaproteobacteria bacterium]